MNSSIVWCDIPARDLDRAIRFYAAVLGATVERNDFEGMSLGVLPHATPGTGGCLVAGADWEPSAQGPLIYLNCEGRLEAAIAAVSQHGGRVIEPRAPIGPHGFRAVVIDSEGNRVALHSM